MANIGFKKAIFTIGTKQYVLDKTKGGTIDAKITGISNESVTVDASDVPFFVYQKGVGKISCEMTAFDLQAVTGLYEDLFGVETVNGFTVVGQNTAPKYTSLVLVSENADGKDLYFGLMKGKFAHPEVELETKKDGKAEPKTVKTKGDFIVDSRGYAYTTGVQADDKTEAEFIKFVNNTTV